MAMLFGMKDSKGVIIELLNPGDASTKNIFLIPQTFPPADFR
jgi:hypothetical protein